ncbi:MAG: HD domain-containing protein [Patescibacteria group bacterium]|jgi:hypothetical protein
MAHFSSVVENAIRLSSYWHREQLRQNTEFTYFTHLAAVATILAKAGFSEDIVAAGFCHDVLNYTDCSPEELREACGDKVFGIVKALTLETGAKSKNKWEKRRLRLVSTVEKAGWEVKAVCVANELHNLQILMEMVQEYGLLYFKSFFIGPEEVLWYEDQVCMMLQDTWKHPLVEEYDSTIDGFVEYLEKLDKEEVLPMSAFTPAEGVGRLDFDEPVKDIKAEKLKELEETVDSAPTANPEEGMSNGSQSNMPTLVRIQEEVSVNVADPAKEERKLGKYLTNEEYLLLFPVALQLGISKNALTTTLLQETLKVNYLTAFKILKEMKRLHVIPRADSFKPRKVDIAIAKEIIAEIENAKG